MLLTESAPGKTILIGEHAVLFGVPAVASALAEGVTVTAETSVQRTSWHIDHKPLTGETALTRGLALATQAAEEAGFYADFRISSLLPGGMGLGWSASVAWASAKLIGKKAGYSHEQTFALAEAMEQCFHGRASGLDLATVASEGTIRFHLEEGRKSVEPLPYPPPGVAVLAGTEPSSTLEMVAMVRALVESNRPSFDQVFQNLTSYSKEISDAILAKDGPRLGKVLSKTHRELHYLKITTPLLDSVVHTAEHAGAWGAKVTGAGGGGCVLCLCAPEAAPKVMEAVRPLVPFVKVVGFVT